MELQERILLAGGAGTGKTYGWLTIARYFSNSKFYVIDPDDGVRRVWYSEFPEVNNIEYYVTPKWYGKNYETCKNRPVAVPIKGRQNCYQSGVADAWKLIKPKLKENDWVIIEHLGTLWDMVQSGFASEIFRENVGEYFLETRKNLKPGDRTLDAFKGWTDWPTINKMHNDDFIIPVCFENPAHVLMTSSISISTSGDKEDIEVKQFYGDTKIRIEGQKRNPFRAQTILLLTRQNRKPPKYMMETFVKDRGRQWIDTREWSDMALDYLLDVGGWEL